MTIKRKEFYPWTENLIDPWIKENINSIEVVTIVTSKGNYKKQPGNKTTVFYKETK